MLTYLQSSRVRLEATCWVLCGHTALDGIAIDPYLVLFQTQLRQTATFTHSQLSMYQIHTGREGERERKTVVILHLLNNKNTPCHRPHSQKRNTFNTDTLSLHTNTHYQARPLQWSGITTDSLKPFSGRLTFQQVQRAEKIFTPVRRESARCLLAPITSIRQAWQLAIRFTTLHSMTRSGKSGL